MSIRTANLFYREGGSDKIYHASIEEAEGGFVVQYSYGRRGSTLTVGTKTPAPVALNEAERVWQKLVNEKLAKGYQPGSPEGTYVPPTQSEQGVVPVALLESVDDPEPYIRNPIWLAQEKFDGKRMLLHRKGDTIWATNRRGVSCGFPEIFTQVLRAAEQDFVIDGEAVGEVYYAFDLLERAGVDRRNDPYWDRLQQLQELLPPSFVVVVAISWRTTQEKRTIVAELRASRAEGVVFKQADAPYRAGRTGLMVKCKFVKTATVRVAAHNQKRSVQMEVLNDQHVSDGVIPISAWLNVGDVTIPPNHAVPAVGALIEVRYLYAFKESNKLFQPVYLGVRDDLREAAVTLSQLQYKREDEE